MIPRDDLTAAVRTELERLLGQREFANSDRMARFLRYSVEHSLAGDRDGLKESVIGSEVFDREPGYDPKTDPVVRNEARRLRTKLEEAYTRTPPSLVRISVPKGSYAAVFEPVSAPPAEAPLPASGPRRFRLAIAAALIPVAIGAAWFLLPRSRNQRLPVLTTLTSYPGRQVTPSLSPDGAHVAFAWGGEKGEPHRIYVADVNGGEPRRLTGEGPAEAYPAWSPDGTRIAFIRSGKLVIARASGGEEHQLAPAFTAPVAWPPDSRSVVFSDWIVSDTVGLISADSLTGARRQLTSPSGGPSDISPAFSADGSRIAFTRCSALGNCDVDVIPASGGQPRQITHERTNISGLAWSPDGRTIVFSSRRLGPFQLWRIPASGGTPELIPVAGEEALFPRFSARAAERPRLVYEQEITDSNIWAAPVTMSAAGPVEVRQPARLIASTRLDHSPKISPDARKIVFVSNRSGFDELWTVNVDGSNPAAVTQMRTGSMGSPRWSPDSARLVFDATTDAGRAVFIVDAAGGTPRQWTPYGTYGRPSWSADGRSIYYHLRDKGRYELWKASSTDSDQRQRVAANALDASESPDGASLFFVRGQELWRMPAAGPATAAEQVPTGIPMSHGWWALAAGGVYFVDLISPPAYSVFPLMKGPKAVWFYDLRTRTRRQIGTISSDLTNTLPDLSVSPDGSRIYYSTMEISVSQVRMIEGGV
jgi:Tol biopolymer transport system component